MYFAWLFYFILILGLLILSRMIVKYYMDPAECYSFALVSISLRQNKIFTLSMICILIVPLDVFVTSHHSQVFQTLHIQINIYFIKQLFIYLYVILLFFTFVILPFNYFYGASKENIETDDFDLDPQDKLISNKIVQAMKSTAIFLLSIAVFLILGLFFRPGISFYVLYRLDQDVSYERGKEVQWIKSLFDVEHVGEQAVGFCVSILLSLGSSFWFIYGSYGLTALPINLIKGTKSLNEEKYEVDRDLAKLKEKYRSIQDKYSRSHLKISKNDQKALSNIKKQERMLSFKNNKIDEIENQSKSLQALFKIIQPFRVFIGLFASLLSLAIFGSLLITGYQKINYSTCGLGCGYLIEQKSLLNPIDMLLVKSSFYFPLDYFLFFILTLYIFICTLYGIVRLGVNFLCITVNNEFQNIQKQQSLQIKKQQTSPSVLFIIAFILNINTLVVCNQLMTLCPQYATFGNQQFYERRTRDYELCTLQAVSKVEAKFICQMTILSSFYNKISVGFPLFGVIFFLSLCAFLVMTIINFLFFLCKSKSSSLDFVTNDVEAEMDDENTSFLYH